MSALLSIQDMRRTLERIEFVNQLQLAMRGEPKDVQKVMQRWARHAEIELRFDEG